MKIYTKTGDDGSTGLFGGGRIDKDDLRIEAFGTVDELNSHLGLLADWISFEGPKAQLCLIQSNLFIIGSMLAKNPASKNAWIPDLPPNSIHQLETWIDEMDNSLPMLQNFILPGGSALSAQAHICRCVCRRGERRAVSLLKNDSSGIEILSYLNRLSDYLFVLSRYLNHELNSPEIPWISGR